VRKGKRFRLSYRGSSPVSTDPRAPEQAGRGIPGIKPGMTRQRGIALVVVLWIVTLLALQVSVFNLGVRDAAALAGNELASARGQALAAAGVEMAASRLMERDLARRWQGNGSLHTLAFGGARVEIAILDESARIDLNDASEELLASLLQPFAPSQVTLRQWVDRILDWRDVDSDRRPQGAEDIDYRRAGVGYGPRNGPFLDASELARVLGIPVDVAEGLSRHLTVFSGEGKINPLLASREALLLLPGADPLEVDQALRLRSGAGAGAGGQAALGALSRWFTSRVGPTYRVKVVVHGDDRGAVIGRAEAVILVGMDAATPYRGLVGGRAVRASGGRFLPAEAVADHVPAPRRGVRRVCPHARAHRAGSGARYQ
jgi:general secretion pathway protein K